MSSPISAVSQMLERNQALFVGKRLLVCGALEDDYPRQLATLTHSLTVFTTDYCYYRSQQAALGIPSYSTISSAAPPFRCPAAADAQGQGRGPVSAGHDDPTAGGRCRAVPRR